MKQSQSKQLSIAIIGGGFAGVATLAHLIAQAKPATNLFLIEKSNYLAKGVAYGTECSWHPLNVRALEMGALDGMPGDFYSWLRQQEKNWRNIDPAFQSLEISPNAFLPRKLYASYLSDLFQFCLRNAQQRGINCEIIQDEAIDADYDPSQEKIDVSLKSGRHLAVDAMVLALGSPPVKALPFETADLLHNPHYTRNPWTPHFDSLLNQRSSKAHDKSHLILIGSGLTAVDTLFTLKANGFRGSIDVISTQGRFPCGNTAEALPPITLQGLENLPKKNLNLLRFLRKEIAAAEKQGQNWRQIINALRPFTSTIWQFLPLSEKRQFLRHLFPIWNIHRHRMSPESASLLESFCKEKSLKISAGFVKSMKGTSKGLEIEFFPKNSGKKKILHADYAINCTGPNYNVLEREDELVQNLLKKKLVVPDELGLGFRLATTIELESEAQGKIYALGSLLFGEKFETTAVPEIRQQASAIAHHILEYKYGVKK